MLRATRKASVSKIKVTKHFCLLPLLPFYPCIWWMHSYFLWMHVYVRSCMYLRVTVRETLTERESFLSLNVSPGAEVWCRREENEKVDKRRMKEEEKKELIGWRWWWSRRDEDGDENVMTIWYSEHDYKCGFLWRWKERESSSRSLTIFFPLEVTFRSLYHHKPPSIYGTLENCILRCFPLPFPYLLPLSSSKYSMHMPM